MNKLLQNNDGTRKITKNPELNALINLTSTDNEEVRGDINWQELYDLAKFHGLTSIVNMYLQNNPNDRIPNHITDSFSDDSKRIYLYNCFLSDQLIKIISVLNQNQITVVPFKGPIIATQEYIDISHRMFSDLDIFIYKQDFKKIQEILAGLEFKQVYKLKPTIEEKYLTYLYYSNFQNIDNGIIIDLHWATAPNNLTHSINLDDLSGEIIKTELQGKELPTLSTESTLLLLCQHGCKHAWSRLIWLYDIVRILENNKNLDWDKIVSLGTKKNSIKMLLTSLNLAQLLFRVEIPNEIKQRIGSDHSVRKISNRILENLESINSLNAKIYNDFIYIRTIEGLLDKTNLMLNHLRPTPMEFDYGLPDSLFYGYYILRPFRLAFKQFSRILN